MIEASSAEKCDNDCSNNGICNVKILCNFIRNMDANVEMKLLGMIATYKQQKFLYLMDNN